MESGTMLARSGAVNQREFVNGHACDRVDQSIWDDNFDKESKDIAVPSTPDRSE
jgi:hypothetical protein